MNAYFGIIMFICIIPVLLINYFLLYPKKWEEKKTVLGVNRRKEFSDPAVAPEVEKIAGAARKQAKIISGICFLIAVLLLFLPGMLLQTFTWCCFIYAAIVASVVPYLLGHKQMMGLKRRLGLANESGVSFVDLKTAGKIRALKLRRVVLPCVLGFAAVAVTFLFDLRVLRVSGYEPTGFLGTAMMAVLWLTSLLFVGIAVLMDRQKSDVISRDSDVNANYNRAKKLCYANLSVTYLWINTLFMILAAAAFLFFYSEVMMMVITVLYMVLLMAGTGYFVHSQKRVEALYQKQIELISDDDEHWIGGMFYYNPSDRRLNVEKRAGVGGTINLAHPVGKLVGVILAGCLLMTVMSFVWIGLLESTPISLTVRDQQLICHQLRDEYVIPFDTIESAEWGEDISSHRLIRVSGVGMDSLLKGKFAVDGENGCRVFLAPLEKVYIKVTVKDGPTYYVSGKDAEETKAAYEALP